MAEETKPRTVQAIVREHAGDEKLTAGEIAAKVREELGDNVKTTAKSVASMLCRMREKLGVDAVPYRARRA